MTRPSAAWGTLDSKRISWAEVPEVPPRYEIRLRNGHQPVSLAFPDFDVVAEGSVLLLRAELDQAALHGALERIRVLGLDLLDLRRTRSVPVRRGLRAPGAPAPGARPGGAHVERSAYEVRVVGAIGPAARDAFRDLAVDVEPTATVLSGDLDRTQLHEVLEHIGALGLELIDVKQARSARAPVPPEDRRG
jgi:hypothetical protein